MHLHLAEIVTVQTYTHIKAVQFQYNRVSNCHISLFTTFFYSVNFQSIMWGMTRNGIKDFLRKKMNRGTKFNYVMTAKS